MDAPDLLILLGSARPDGDTAAAVLRFRQAFAPREAELLDLRAAKLLPFDYDRPRQDDGFDRVVSRILDHKRLLIATPVYWYSMSGIIKTFLDRLSDLLSDRDPLRRGRQLAGRDLWLLAVGTDPALPGGFTVPFAATAAYLGIGWRGACYCRSGKYAEAEATTGAIQCLSTKIAGLSG